MLQLKFKPELHYFDTCREFAEAFRLTGEDLVLTNRYIYEPFFGPLNLPVHVVCQEEFGSGEPTDVMVNAILRVMEKRPCRRIIAVGGGTVLDIAKVLAVAVPVSWWMICMPIWAISRRGAHWFLCLPPAVQAVR